MGHWYQGCRQRRPWGLRQIVVFADLEPNVGYDLSSDEGGAWQIFAALEEGSRKGLCGSYCVRACLSKRCRKRDIQLRQLLGFI